MLKYSQTLKTVTFTGFLEQSEILILPQSVTTVHLNQRYSLKTIIVFLEQNPFIREVTVEFWNLYDFSSILRLFPHIKFNSSHYHDPLFDFKHFYGYFHPEIKQPGISFSEPDHILYELLFQRLTDKYKLFRPYFKLVTNHFEHYSKKLSTPPHSMMDQISVFDEFLQVLLKFSDPKIYYLQASHFDRVFNYQLAQCADSEYLRIVLSSYDEAFQLGGNVDQAVTQVKGMTQVKLQTIKRQSYFNACKQNWSTPLTPEDFIP
ncbi:hypothetical protein FGO68_gene9110 [Halteria grandinella]|uniref:Uncharacterized protein n=1 Tax=Halteria grandinella TaxID=5974 RepID=A0A8J8NGD0_HALGN|nr:hypothetical protein FGO68_gene9110 [Halteria grandinella]